MKRPGTTNFVGIPVSKIVEILGSHGNIQLKVSKGNIKELESVLGIDFGVLEKETPTATATVVDEVATSGDSLSMEIEN